jgi:hypothetical protein
LQPSPRKFDNVFVQVVDGEIEQRCAGSLGVMEYLQPTGIGNPPLDQGHRRMVVSWAPHEALVPCPGPLDVRDGYYGKKLFDRHHPFPSETQHLLVIRKIPNPDLGGKPKIRQ